MFEETFFSLLGRAETKYKFVNARFMGTDYVFSYKQVNNI